jgi:hypothetical protein
MTKKSKKAKAFQKVIDELFVIPKKRGGGLIKIEAWEDSRGHIVKYSLAYINHEIFSGDNGRVLGYDNTHNYHHRHYFGEFSVIEDFTTYENLVNQFEQEIGEFIR